MNTSRGRKTTALIGAVPNKKILKRKAIYLTSKAAVSGLQMKGFFAEWPNKPEKRILQKSIENADYVVLAVDPCKNQLIGYITAVSDGVLAANIPFLEVVEGFQGQGIGGQLLKKMLKQLSHLYMIDLVCDKELADFYEKAGFQAGHAMMRRNYANQRGRQRRILN
jgi:GNAT superfamily N-acetyltransferase